MNKFKRILIIEGIPGAGKSYLVKELKEEFSKTVFFLKHPGALVKDKILKNKSPLYTDEIFKLLLWDADRITLSLINTGLKKDYKFELKENIVIERWVMSTLIGLTMSSNIKTLEKDAVHLLSKTLGKYKKLFQNVEYEKALYLNLDVDISTCAEVLRDRREEYYRESSDYLKNWESASKKAFKLTEDLFVKQLPNMDLLNVSREEAWIKAEHFLKGGN